MSILAFNFSWMGFNTFLAFLPLILGWLFYLTKNRIIKYVFGFLWLIFVPNSIYLFTDLIHFLRQWSLVGGLEKMTLVFQYSFLLFVGLFTFILSIYPIEKYTNEYFKKSWRLKFLIALNFLIGFGMTLGRVERANSWHIVSMPLTVLESVVSIISSVQLLFLAILLGLFANFLYFLFRDPVVKYVNTYVAPID